MNDNNNSGNRSKRRKDRANPVFHLSQNSISTTTNIIKEYAKIDGSISYKQFVDRTGEKGNNVTLAHGFLVDLKILEGDVQKSCTPLGRELGLALLYGTEEDIKKSWMKVIDGNEFCLTLLRDISERGEVRREGFQKRIFYFAKYNDPTNDIRVGANTLIKIFLLVNYVTKSGAYYKVSIPYGKLQQGKGITPEIPEDFEHFRIFLPSFFADHPSYDKNVFLMMRFRKGIQYQQIHTLLRDMFTARGFHLLRADDKDYTGDLWSNVCVHMLGCKYGVSVFEEINEREFNPNVAIELGFMFGLGKRCLILKDQRMPKLPVDIIGKLYKQFDTYDMDTTIALAVESWLNDLGFQIPG